MKQRPEAQGLPARELVREGPVQLAPNGFGVLAEHGVQVLLHVQQLCEDLQRVTPHVEVVIGVLLDPPEPRELGQQRAQHVRGLHQLEPGQRVSRGDQLPQLVEAPLGRDRL